MRKISKGGLLMAKMYEGTRLVKFDNNDGMGNWVLEGSENDLTYPQYHSSTTKGILIYGIKKVNGLSCLVIANKNLERAKLLGLTCCEYSPDTIKPLFDACGEERDPSDEG
jgi:hypothetical protein